jgi:hypothetical protein
MLHFALRGYYLLLLLVKDAMDVKGSSWDKVWIGLAYQAHLSEYFANWLAIRS